MALFGSKPKVPKAPKAPAAPGQPGAAAGQQPKKNVLESLKNMDVKDIAKLLDKKGTQMAVAKQYPGGVTNFEVNLVPEIKDQMIKSIKLRNLVLFICIIIVIVAGSVIGVLGGVLGGQSATLAGQDTRLTMMSNKINNYDSLSDFLTIQEQLNGLSSIDENKKVLSRVFPMMSVLLPSGADKITLSELSLNLETNTIIFTGQADAGVAPLIDYRVLDSFKKGVVLTKYDYGRYVDENDLEIPTRCMVEAREDGTALIDSNGSMYAYWLKSKPGCNPSEEDEDLEDEEEESLTTSGSGSALGFGTLGTTDLSNGTSGTATGFGAGGSSSSSTSNGNSGSTAVLGDGEEMLYGEFPFDYNSLSAEEQWIVNQITSAGVNRSAVEYVRIYRTPQYDAWYKAGYMDLDGAITEIPHFDSQCIQYSGLEIDSGIRWTIDNQCMLADNSEGEAIIIRDSSNGRDASGNLVLRFDASILIDENVFSFANKHMIAIGPNGQNVTDSYVQIEGMFEQRADDCNAEDVVCISDTANTGDGEANGGVDEEDLDEDTDEVIIIEEDE